MREMCNQPNVYCTSTQCPQTPSEVLAWVRRNNHSCDINSRDWMRINYSPVLFGCQCAQCVSSRQHGLSFVGMGGRLITDPRAVPITMALREIFITLYHGLLRAYRDWRN